MKGEGVKRKGEITGALRKFAADVKEVDETSWRFVLRNGRSRSASARYEDGWLLMEAAWKKKRRNKDNASFLEYLLKANGTLKGGTKFVLPASQLGREMLRSEIPVLNNTQVKERCRAACAGLKEGFSTLRRRAQARGAGSGRPALRKNTQRFNKTDENAPSLLSFCRSAGWHGVPRSNGRVAVELETLGRPRRAILQKLNGKGLRLSVELYSFRKLPRISCYAIALFLLAVSAAVRMARAVWTGSAGGDSFQMECVFENAPCEAELNHALSALSVACCLCGEEVEVLTDERTAGEYLRVRGWPWTPESPAE